MLIAALFTLVLLAALLIAFLALCAISACMLSSQISQAEERKKYDD